MPCVTRDSSNMDRLRTAQTPSMVTPKIRRGAASMGRWSRPFFCTCDPSFAAGSPSPLSGERVVHLSIVRVATALSLLVLAIGCGGSDGGTNPTVNVGGFAVSLSNTTLSVQQGASGSVTATIARTGTFTGTVNLSTENVPAGITPTFTPSAITTGTTSAALNVSVATTVAPVSYTFTIRGQASGQTDQTATVSMTVTPRPALTVALSPASGTAAIGGSTTFNATVTAVNFTGTSSVAVTGNPTGTAVQLNAAVGGAVPVTISVNAGATPGTYPLTVTASGAGAESGSATFSLTITPAPAGTITLAAAPSALSVQAGGASATTILTITRTNFTGNVTLGAQSGLPAGATVTFNPGPVTGDGTSIATFAAGPSTTPGSYNVVLQAAGTGAATGTAAISLTVTAAPTGSIAIAATSATLNATAGGAAVSSTIDITRTNFTGNVSFAVSGLPAGGGGSFSPSPTAGNSTTLSLTFGVGVAAGTYPVTVTASGTGIAPVSTQVSVTVAAAPAAGIALSMTQNPVSVQQGANANTSVVITRTNFAGQVNLALSGVPANVTATLGSPSTLSNGSTLTFAAAVNAAPGSYTVTISGSGTGISNASTTVTLNVTQASAGNVAFSFCGPADDIPIWFAAQNGSGNWTQVAGTNNAYSPSITSAGGVAWVTQEGSNSFALVVYYGTTSELSAIGARQCTSPVTKSVTGTVAGLGAADQASVQFGGRAPTTAPTFVSPNFTIANVPDGLRDLFATRSSFSQSGITLNKIFLRRGLNPANNASVGTVDFNGADSFTPDSKTLTVTGATGGESVTSFAAFNTANGSSLALGLPTLGGGSFFAVPSSRTVAGDLHVLTALAGPNDGSRSRLVLTAFRDAVNTTVALGSALSTPAFSVTSISGGEARIRTQLARQSEYQDAWAFTFIQSGASLARGVTLVATPAYIGSASTIDLSIPNFSTVAGWQTLWGIRQGTPVMATAAASGYVSGNGINADGMLTRSATVTSNLTP